MYLLWYIVIMLINPLDAQGNLTLTPTLHILDCGPHFLEEIEMQRG